MLAVRTGISPVEWEKAGLVAINTAVDILLEGPEEADPEEVWKRVTGYPGDDEA